MRIENSDIKVCSFKPTSPEAIGSNVEMCTILGIGSGACENFPVIGCRSGSMQTSLQKIGCQVPDFIVSYGREATFWTG